MLKLVSFVALCLCLTFVSALPSRLPLQKIHFGGIRAHWKQTNTPIAKDHLVEFTIALKQRNTDKLEELFWDRSNPQSENYAKWMTIEEIQDLVSPPKKDQNRVMNWLKTVGIESLNPKIEATGKPVAQCFGDFISVSATVEQTNKLFRFVMKKYVHVEDSSLFVIRSASNSHPTIPAKLNDIITMVTGLTEMPVTRKSNKREVADPSTSYLVVPQTLRTIYNVPEDLIATNKNTTQCVVEFGPVAGVSQADLTKFQSDTDTQNAGTIDYTVGGFKFSPFNPINGEATLDVQYILSMGPGANTSFWTVDGWMYDLNVLIQKRLTRGLAVPLVFSMSYGWAESQQCEITGAGESCKELGGGAETYVTRTNAEFQKSGLTGRSIVGLSQDAGAASKWNRECIHTPEVNPSYPGASPYILTLGATMEDPATLLTNPRPPICKSKECSGGGQEVVCTVPTALITSGGGFSNFATRPAYQNKAVTQWLQKNSLRPQASLFNSSNRGYPDLSTLGHQYYIVEGGRSLIVDGTSASCPAFAGMVSLMNDWRLTNNKPALGPLNTLFYQMWENSPQTFQDITIGNNTGTEKGGLLHPNGCFTQGYGATQGWDPATGLGSPNFGEMLKYIRNLN